MTPRLIAVGLSLIGLCFVLSASAKGTQAFLVQNSGWMEPFYVDRNSQFKPLVQALITAVAEPGDQIIVAAFNQSAGENRSPQIAYQGLESKQAAQSVTGIQPARKPGGVAYSDTDFKEAITSVIKGPAKAQPTVVWIITNNRNSPGNDQNTAARNRDFYELVHNEPSIISAFAYPLAMPVKGQLYSAKGLMIYALTYGESADAKLRGLMGRRAPAAVLTDRPARLKPLDRESMTFVPQGSEATQQVRVSLEPDRRTLALAVDASTTPQRVALQGAFRNDFYPYEILAGSISATMVAGDWSGELSVQPKTVTKAIPPGGDTQVAVELPLPSSQFPSVWSPSALLAMGTQVEIPAELRISLDQQRLRLSDEFLKRLGEVFPGDPLPDVFRPPERIAASVATLPVRFSLAYPLYPLIVVGISFLALVAAVLVSVAAFTREKRFEVLVNGQLRRVAVRPFASVEIKLPDGATAGTLKRGLGAPQVISVTQGHQVRVKA